jgi:signal peptidase I
MADDRIKIQGQPLPHKPVGGPVKGGAAAQPATEKAKQPTAPKDTFREIVETIVFVVVLVLLLKTFVAEAFVIPTGSMATTLLGYHKNVTCRACNYTFPVNASKELDEQETAKEPVQACKCENCQLYILLPPYDQKGIGAQ